LRSIPDNGIHFDKLVSDIEIELILKASRQCGWNQSRTAELLQMKRDKLRYRMKIYNIASERKRGPGRPAGDDEDDALDGADSNLGGGPESANSGDDHLRDFDLEGHKKVS
jgi:hypothetical protein